MSLFFAAAILDIETSDWEWRKNASCIGVDPEVFFPKAPTVGTLERHYNDDIPVVLVRRAQEFCSRCEVRAECLDYAMAHAVEDGIWAGTTPKDRRRLRKQRRQS